ncbi:unnamed protein product [Psylliodes chrysocephalus]|uniref:Uncharacterized protein n=1 Tax=Psylliodes chrysocephalus TaxID=3402493 RepID=A0A9P0CV19_9CUCU|nr:unnamed protein product [Psylliodes chrysocephala]
MNIEKYGGCPRKIRSDMGPENGTVEQMQTFLRGTAVKNEDQFLDDNSFIYGTSQCNQRSEFWWGILRKHCSQYWMNVLGCNKQQGSVRNRPGTGRPRTARTGENIERVRESVKESPKTSTRRRHNLGYQGGLFKEFLSHCTCFPIKSSWCKK